MGKLGPVSVILQQNTRNWSEKVTELKKAFFFISLKVNQWMDWKGNEKSAFLFDC